MTETSDSEILHCLKIHEALWGWLSSFISLACWHRILQKEPLSKVRKIRPPRGNWSHRGGGLRCGSQERGWLKKVSWGSFFPQTQWPQVREALSGSGFCPCKMSPLIFWSARVPVIKRICSRWFELSNFNKVTSYTCVYQVRGTCKGE